MKKWLLFSEKKKLLIISICIFVVSLTQKTYCTEGDCGIFGSGFFCLSIGWLAMLAGGAFFTWLANPFLILAWIFLYKKIKTSNILSGIALIISLSFLFFTEIMVDEAGHYEDISGYRLGYWLWVLSSVILFIGTIRIRIIENKKKVFSE